MRILEENSRYSAEGDFGETEQVLLGEEMRRLSKTEIWLLLTFVGIACLLAIIRYWSSDLERLEAEKCFRNLENTGVAVRMYCIDNAGEFPTALQRLPLEGSLSCPSTGLPYAYEHGDRTLDPDALCYTVTCGFERHFYYSSSSHNVMRHSRIDPTSRAQVEGGLTDK